MSRVELIDAYSSMRGKWLWTPCRLDERTLFWTRPCFYREYFPKTSRIRGAMYRNNPRFTTGIQVKQQEFVLYTRNLWCTKYSNQSAKFIVAPTRLVWVEVFPTHDHFFTVLNTSTRIHIVGKQKPMFVYSKKPSSCYVPTIHAVPDNPCYTARVCATFNNTSYIPRVALLHGKSIQCCVVTFYALF